MKVALAAAVAENGVIGGDGDLLWRISDDLKWFKKVTLGKPIIMGRKTFESIGKPLPGRDNIIITRSNVLSAGGAFVVRSVTSAIKLATACAGDKGGEEVCIIGGAEVYRQTLAIADRIYLTRVDASPQGDAIFPEIDSRAWNQRSIGGCEKNEQNQYACEFFILERRQPEA